MSIPRISDTVHYAGHTGQCCAAIVTAVPNVMEARPPLTIALAVFNTRDMFFAQRVTHDETRNPGTWHYVCASEETREQAMNPLTASIGPADPDQHLVNDDSDLGEPVGTTTVDGSTMLPVVHYMGHTGALHAVSDVTQFTSTDIVGDVTCDICLDCMARGPERVL